MEMVARRPKATRRSCKVPGCRMDSRQHPEKSFFVLPRKPKQAQIWLRKLQLDPPMKHMNVTVCEDHFLPADISRRTKRVRLLPDSIPMLKIPPPPINNSLLGEMSTSTSNINLHVILNPENKQYRGKRNTVETYKINLDAPATFPFPPAKRKATEETASSNNLNLNLTLSLREEQSASIMDQNKTSDPVPLLIKTEKTKTIRLSKKSNNILNTQSLNVDPLQIKEVSFSNAPETSIDHLEVSPLTVKNETLVKIESNAFFDDSMTTQDNELTIMNENTESIKKEYTEDNEIEISNTVIGESIMPHSNQGDLHLNVSMTELEVIKNEKHFDGNDGMVVVKSEIDAPPVEVPSVANVNDLTLKKLMAYNSGLEITISGKPIREKRLEKFAEKISSLQIANEAEAEEVMVTNNSYDSAQNNVSVDINLSLVKSEPCDNEPVAGQPTTAAPDGESAKDQDIPLTALTTLSRGEWSGGPGETRGEWSDGPGETRGEGSDGPGETRGEGSDGPGETRGEGSDGPGEPSGIKPKQPQEKVKSDYIQSSEFPLETYVQDHFISISALRRLFEGDTSALSFHWEPTHQIELKREIFRPTATRPTPCFDSPYNAFRCYWDDEILENIVRETNRNGMNMKSSDSTPWYPTDKYEILVLFGFWILLGVRRMPTYDSCFSDNPLLSTEVFRNMFEKRRFFKLSKTLCFANITEHRRRCKASLWLLDPIVKHLNFKFQYNYTPSRNVSVCEVFPQHESTQQPAGINTFGLLDPATGYVWSIFMCNYKSRQNSVLSMNNSTFLNLLKPLLKQGHTIFLDDRFTSPLLARYLKRNQTDCVGMIRPSKLNIDPVKNGQLQGDNLVTHSCGDMAVVSWRDEDAAAAAGAGAGAVKCALSTYHTKKSNENPHAFKSAILLDYENCMLEQEVDETILAPYLEEISEWYVKIFKKLLNCSVLNARILEAQGILRDEIEFRLSIVQAIMDECGSTDYRARHLRGGQARRSTRKAAPAAAEPPAQAPLSLAETPSPASDV